MKIFKLFHYKNYTKLYCACFVSELGSFVTEISIMLFIFAKTGDNKAYLGITRAIFLLFFVLGSFSGGMLGQRFNRRNILITCDLSRIVAVLAILWFDNIYLIILCNGLLAFFTGVFNPTRQAILNDFIPVELIRYANALFAQTLSIIYIIGPFLGAQVYMATGRMAEILIFDLITYIIGIFLLLRITFILKTQEAQKQDFVKEFKQTLLSILRRKELCSLYFNTFIVGNVIGLLIPLLLPFVKESLNGGAREYGHILLSFGMGGLIGGVIFSRLVHFIHEGKIIVIVTLLEVFLFNLWVRIEYFTASFCIMFVWGIFVLIRYTAQFNYISKSVESRYLVPSYAFLEMCFMVPNILGGILVGFIVSGYTSVDIFKVTGIAFGIVMLLRVLLGELSILYKHKIIQVERSNVNYN